MTYEQIQRVQQEEQDWVFRTLLEEPGDEEMIFGVRGADGAIYTVKTTPSAIQQWAEQHAECEVWVPAILSLEQVESLISTTNERNGIQY